MNVIEEGKNAWRVERSLRVAFLVDGAAYFAAVADAFEQARKSIHIIGWDFNSDVRLRRNGESGTSRLKDLLWAVLKEQPDLQVYVLLWDFTMLFAFERDLLPLFHIAWSGEPRLHFHMDKRHALGGCHHQKVVVVDDAVAFVGGMDLTKARWDLPRHEATDSRRVDPSGHAYAPVHDVQMMVDGAAARALGDLARDRWRRATGETLPDTSADKREIWPSSMRSDIEDVDVAIVRTWPAVGGDGEIREVERLYLDAIASAERFIYIENQYFTSSAIVDALSGRLQQSNSPEIVAVLPIECSGWLEQNTMGALRVRALKRLLSTDGAVRFRAYSPVVPGSVRVLVHSKLIIVDDRLLMIGSANLSNRSMGFDSECNLAIEQAVDSETSRAIAGLRDRLLAEHLGVSIGEVAGKLDETGSLLETIEELRGNEKTLEPLEPEQADWSESLVDSVSAFDPERPVDPEELVERFVSPPEPSDTRRLGRRFGFAVLALMALAALWRWAPLGDVASRETLLEWMALAEGSAATPVVVVIGYVVASLLMFPMTLLILVTALAFEPLTAAVYALSGGVLSAASGFGLGRVLGKDAIRRVAGTRLNRVSKRLARRGLVAMISARLLPLGPFTIVNLIAGASHIRFRDFMLGSFFGLLPGIGAVTVLKGSLQGVMRDPTPVNVAIILGVGVIVLVGVLWARHRFGSRPRERTVG